MPGSTTFTPLAYRAFALILVGSLLSNFGNAVQSVGAAWQMTATGQPADVVALVQTAVNLPIMLLALPAGAWADMFDKRTVMLLAQTAMFAVSLLLVTLTFAGITPPLAIVGLTALLAAGVAVFNPALAASIGGIVPRAELAAAVALNILAFNFARTAGPALGGAIVSLGGAGAAFVANALSYLMAIAVLWRWRPAAEPAKERRRLLPVIAEGFRFALASPQIRTILLRALTFTLTGAAAWALMPLVAADLLGEGSAVYGLLLGALGAGAVIGALTSTWFRARFSAEAIIRTAGIVYGLGCLGVALQPGLVPMLFLLVVAGAGWVQALSGFSVAGQLWAPREVVGRIVALVSSLTFGGIALGSWLWGHFAEVYGVAAALAASGGGMIVLPLIGLLLPMPGHEAPRPGTP
ncbi:MFS transporter [Altererythrobacter soli]|uniref:MFS transporter n=1 Tax=Croceibacterium soli TaxID=1739690 RepID=A0A6I4US96_9SPHN|nr:MFS transporter [Croceibacterium soli]MXP41326.1 MFS transporter [Croceibacterium soli]